MTARKARKAKYTVFQVATYTQYLWNKSPHSTPLIISSKAILANWHHMLLP